MMNVKKTLVGSGVNSDAMGDYADITAIAARDLVITDDLGNIVDLSTTATDYAENKPFYIKQGRGAGFDPRTSVGITKKSIVSTSLKNYDAPVQKSVLYDGITVQTGKIYSLVIQVKDSNKFHRMRPSTRVYYSERTTGTANTDITKAINEIVAQANADKWLETFCTVEGLQGGAAAGQLEDIRVTGKAQADATLEFYSFVDFETNLLFGDEGFFDYSGGQTEAAVGAITPTNPLIGSGSYLQIRDLERMSASNEGASNLYRGFPNDFQLGYSFASVSTETYDLITIESNTVQNQNIEGVHVSPNVTHIAIARGGVAGAGEELQGDNAANTFMGILNSFLGTSYDLVP